MKKTSPESQRINRENVWQHIKHYLVAIALVGLASGLRVWPLQALESGYAWLTFYPAVIAVALYAGFSAGLLATVLACLTVTFLWPLFVAHPFLNNPFDFLEMIIFSFIGIIISYLVDAVRRAQKTYKQTESASMASAKCDHFIKSITDIIPNMIGYWDRDLRCRFANNAYQEWFGKLPEDIIGMTMRELTGKQLFAMNEPYIRGALAGNQQRFQRTLTKANGSVGHILAYYVPDIDADGAVNGFAILASEVTDLKETEAKLKMAASVFENTVDGIIITDAKGVILSVNQAFSEITGYAAEEAIGQTPRILKSNRHSQSFYAAMWKDITANSRWKGEIWNRRKSGDIFLERVTITMIRDAEGETVRYVSVFSDITDLWRKDEHLRHLAFHDALTDLPNRSLLMERLDQNIVNSEREQCHLALMFMDLDGFKLVNDHYGHAIGDEVLRVVAQRLLALVRHSDTVARLGGDEFVIKLNNPSDIGEISSIANRIVSVVNEPMEIRGEVVQVGTSIGIAIFPNDGQTSFDLIKNADTAMYAAKGSGKNTVRFFAPEKVQP